MLSNGPLHAAVIALSNTVLQLVVSFGASITDAQNAAITGVINAIFIVAALILAAYRANRPAPPFVTQTTHTISSSGEPPAPPTPPAQ